MATTAAMKPSNLSSSLRFVSSCVRSSRRNLTTVHRPITQTPRCAAIRPPLPRAQLLQAFRRSYADAVSPITKRRGRGFFRWTWRLTYLSVLGGVGYLTYTIYLLRSPNEQFNPDPSKKTLVILGTLQIPSNYSVDGSCPNWHQAPAGAPCLS